MKKSQINDEIIQKINRSKQPKTVKNFLLTALDWEYEHIDEQRPPVKKNYEKFLKKYIG